MFGRKFVRLKSITSIPVATNPFTISSILFALVISYWRVVYTRKSGFSTTNIDRKSPDCVSRFLHFQTFRFTFCKRNSFSYIVLLHFLVLFYVLFYVSPISYSDLSKHTSTFLFGSFSLCSLCFLSFVIYTVPLR